jgi:hypothetical protein
MFGLFGTSKRKKEEIQKAEAITYAIDVFLREFRIALATTADVYGINPSPLGDFIKEDKYLAVMYAVTVSSGAHMDAETDTKIAGLAGYLANFQNNKEIFRQVVNQNNNQRYKNLVEKTAQMYDLIIAGVDRSQMEKLFMSLAQVYFFET